MSVTILSDTWSLVRRQALFQVNEFLQWLDEAVEDDGEDS